MRLPSIFLFFCFAACGGREAIKQAIDETRAPTRIIIEIRLEKTEMPDAKDIELRHKIAESIEHDQIGVVARSTADVGRMDLAVDVKDSVTAIGKIHDVLRRLAIDDHATVRIDETHS